MPHDEAAASASASASASPLFGDLPKRRLALLPASVSIGTALGIVAVIVSFSVSYRADLERRNAAARVTHTLDVLSQAEQLLSSMRGAETGQRGYLLTGDAAYLEPWDTASARVPSELRELRALTADDETQAHRVRTLSGLVDDKMKGMELTIERRRNGDADGALALVKSGRGRALMQSIRDNVRDIEDHERRLLHERDADWDATVRSSFLFVTGGSLLIIAILIAGAVLAGRDFRARAKESWLRAALAAVTARVRGDPTLGRLGDDVITALALLLEAPVGAMYVAVPGAGFHRVGRYAIDGAGAARADDDDDALREGEGLVVQAARDRHPIRVRDVPARYLPVASGVGRADPLELVVAPAVVDDTVQGVIELGFFRRIDDADLELLSRASQAVAVAVRSSRDRTRLEELLAETQQQAEELQAQQEELRVANEELQEQSRVLKESQVSLEAQRAELEETNAQLEEQTRALEDQRDELASAQETLTLKASELERANQYKSEFLANMSHELRTPLNSSLILAKLLSDNKEGNLTEEQVKYAQTISAAGNDLLNLINDILDLSKIASGNMQLNSETVSVTRMLDGLVRTMEPLAQEKNIALIVNTAAGAQDRIDTDGQRVAQILRNLLSNAIKFTERGSVTVDVFAPAPGRVAFSVRDTGIGIAGENLDLIFDAFRQADGSTHRKYGGTGLGLSISRDLARLLGGDVTVKSTVGDGSTFTLELPTLWSPSASDDARTAHPAPLLAPLPRTRTPSPQSPPPASPPPAPPPPAAAPAPQAASASGARSVLIIEDDPRFAAILDEVARPLGFRTQRATGAAEGLRAAKATTPSAIVLDMNLPDHSGLGVLDQLKRDPRTRHIPVHVISVDDHAQAAFGLGAVGYALKPVDRERIVQAFGRLTQKLDQKVRRVLVVEDDLVQRDSVQKLLASDDVEIHGVATAAEALAALSTATYDCVVMDLSLPDKSGADLLQEMSEREDVSFPPVIIYTGRSLTPDEEQRLRRYSRSIIIKDARSPERLLDEVTLFLHQVEDRLPPSQRRMLRDVRERDAALEGRRILVVEDDARNIFALSRVLEPKGAVVEIARNGREALAALAKGPIDVVLMDIMMPEMDGLTAMREIRKNAAWRKLPIIALTAKAMRDDQEKCIAAGANDYIAKPLDVEKLLSLVRVWMPK